MAQGVVYMFTNKLNRKNVYRYKQYMKYLRIKHLFICRFSYLITKTRSTFLCRLYESMELIRLTTHAFLLPMILMTKMNYVAF